MTDEPTPSETPEGVLRRIKQLSNAIALLRESQANASTRTKAVELQALRSRRDSLRARLPRLRLVKRNKETT